VTALLARLTTAVAHARVTQPSAARAAGPTWSCGVSLIDLILLGAFVVVFWLLVVVAVVTVT
jgi:hypothetical protein